VLNNNHPLEVFEYSQMTKSIFLWILIH